MAELRIKPGPVVYVYGSDAFLIECHGARVLIDNASFVNPENEVSHYTCVLNSAPTEAFLANAMKRNQFSLVPVVGSVVNSELKNNLKEMGLQAVVTKQAPDYKPFILYQDILGRLELFVLDGGLHASLDMLRKTLENGNMAEVEKMATEHGMIFALAWFPSNKTQLVRRILYTGKASTKRVLTALEKASSVKLFRVPSVTSGQAATIIVPSPRVRLPPASRIAIQPAGSSKTTTSRSTTPKGTTSGARVTSARLSAPGNLKASASRLPATRLSSAATDASKATSRVPLKPALPRAPLIPSKTAALSSVARKTAGISPKPTSSKASAGPLKPPAAPKAPVAGSSKNVPKSPAATSRTVSAVQDVKPVVVKTVAVKNESSEGRPPIEVITISDTPASTPPRAIPLIVLDDTMEADQTAILPEDALVAAPEECVAPLTPSDSDAQPSEITPEITAAVQELLDNVLNGSHHREETSETETLKSLIDEVIRKIEAQQQLDSTLPVEVEGDWRNAFTNAPVGPLHMPLPGENAVPSKAHLRREVYFEVVTVPHDGEECSLLSAEEAMEFFASVRSRDYIMACHNLDKYMLDGLLEGKKAWLQPTQEVNVYPSVYPQLMADFKTEKREELAAEALVIGDSAVQKLYI